MNLHLRGAQLVRQRGLGFEKLREDDHAAFAARQRREQVAFLVPTGFQRRVVPPGPPGRGREILRAPPATPPGCCRPPAGGAGPTGWPGWPAARPAPAKFALPLLPKRAFRLVRLEQHRLGPARRQVDAGVGASVANHHLAQQPAQLLRLARLVRLVLVHEPGAEFLGGRQLAGLQQRDQVVEFFERILDWRGGQQQQELARQDVDRLPGLRGAVAQVVRFVHDEHVPVQRLGHRQMRGLLEGVERGDDNGVLPPERRRVGPEHRLVGGHPGKIELVLELLLPLVHQRRHGQHQEPLDHAAREEFLEHEARFDGFAQPHFVGQERPPAQRTDDAQGGADLVFEVSDAAVGQRQQIVGLIGDPPSGGGLRQEIAAQIRQGQEAGLQRHLRQLHTDRDGRRGQRGVDGLGGSRGRLLRLAPRALAALILPFGLPRRAPRAHHFHAPSEVFRLARGPLFAFPLAADKVGKSEPFKIGGERRQRKPRRPRFLLRIESNPRGEVAAQLERHPGDVVPDHPPGVVAAPLVRSEQGGAHRLPGRTGINRLKRHSIGVGREARAETVEAGADGIQMAL